MNSAGQYPANELAMKPIVLVTGAAGGLGRAVAARLLSTGARVIAGCASNSDFLELQSALEHPSELFGVTADVTQTSAVQALLDVADLEYGPITGVAHLVGGYQGGVTIDETSDAVWDHMITLNLRSAFLVVRESVRRFRPRLCGSIVVVSSAAALQGVGTGGAAAYVAAKAGVIALVEEVAAELRDQAIRINAVLPTIIRTRANLEAMPNAEHGRWATPEEVAEVIRFLLSSHATGVTGALVKVPGRV